MRTRRRIALMAACAIAAATSGCAHDSSPHGWLSRPEAAQSEAFGAWLEIHDLKAGRDPTYEGEFIGANADTVFVLSYSRLEAIPMDQIVRAKLTAYDARAGTLAEWTFLGTLATLSHGAGLLITAPTWILVGSLASASQSHRPVLTIPKHPWTEAAKFARFPGGLPDNLNRGALVRKR